MCDEMLLLRQRMSNGIIRLLGKWWIGGGFKVCLMGVAPALFNVLRFPANVAVLMKP